MIRGSISHNVKAIYQRYLGWNEGNPARSTMTTTERQEVPDGP
jgi:alkyl sulfatase BDS1-like metallo-beta-lactamase superfamily hydrolase